MDYQIGDIDQPLPSSEPSVETKEVQPNVASGGAIGFDDTEDMSMYANAEDTVSKQTEEPVALGSHSGGSFGVESRTDMKGDMTKSVSNSGVDRGQQAENVFSTVLQNEAQSKQESFTAGLER